ncbi:protein RESPONSE TO LOW SULFUR 3-like [Magnolia sinica]|uniref:protein RESPONSE TO LOW SULFUR 3-like n=1 Tax=Magnolia sinica TaxID=86752 RepID=UPI002659B37F|nr:protein RESPONSE TO LOW SULFUR 3-like [Magnolia sinica]
MALGMALGGPQHHQRGYSDEEEILRRRNEELEKELKEILEREKKVREEIEKTKERLIVVEEAEERLCFQLGEQEAESFYQARAYHVEIRSLKEQLSQARKLIQSATALKDQP